MKGIGDQKSKKFHFEVAQNKYKDPNYSFNSNQS